MDVIRYDRHDLETMWGRLRLNGIEFTSQNMRSMITMKFNRLDLGVPAKFHTFLTK